MIEGNLQEQIILPPKILIVEDEFIIAKDIQRTLKIYGYNVVDPAVSASEAVKRAGEDRPDLVLMDIRLKGPEDGIWAANQIRQSYNIPIIYLTSHSDKNTVERAKYSEPMGYIIKPFEDRELFTTVEMALYRHQMEKVLLDREQALEQLNANLEELIRARTEELETANIELKKEIEGRKILEQELRQALQKEQELGELKNRIISTTSHEFRTPISAILSSVELLQHYGYRWSEEKKVEILERVAVSAKKLTNLLQDVLIYNQAEAGKMECNPVCLDLASFCREKVQEAQIIAKPGQVVQLVERGKARDAWLDPKLLDYILSNLLSNAVKYSNDNGLIELEVDWQAAASSGEVVLLIRDRGIGIPLGDQPHLFEVFYRGSNVGAIGGAGLGLVIVKRSVEILKGRIEVIGRQGEGTTFTIWLPVEVSPNPLATNTSNQCYKFEKDESKPIIKSGCGDKKLGLVEIPKTTSPIRYRWLLERAVEASSSGVIITDHTNEGMPIIYTNRGFERLTGYSTEEVLGHNFTFLLQEEQSKTTYSLINQIIGQGQHGREVTQIKNKAGKLVWVDLQLSPVLDGLTQVAYFIWIFMDITSKVEAEEALRASVQKYKALVENSPHVIARFDLEGRHIYVNPAFSKANHSLLSVEDLIGKTMAELDFDDERRKRWEYYFNQVLQTGREVDYVFEQTFPNEGTESFQVRIIPEFSSDSKQIVSILCVAHDITKNKMW